MSCRPYTVHIYEDEATLISKWTLRYLDIETGGDLFGLWLNENEVVIQAVLGPGQKCRRNRTLFFQDEEYLNKAGSLLTLGQGLCNVGSWHSHHTMNLSEPSRGDKDTVWRHLPTPGRFLLLITNIEKKTGTPKVKMNFNLFESTKEGNKVMSMKISILPGQSPIRANEEVSRQICQGCEVIDKGLSKTKSSNEPVMKIEIKEESEPGRPDVTRPDMKTNERYNDVSGFFRGQTTRPLGHRRSQNEKTTCDGGHLYSRPYETSSYAGRSEFRHQRQIYHTKWISLPNGKEGLICCHQLGGCEICYQATVNQKIDGNFYVEHSQSDFECCIIL